MMLLKNEELVDVERERKILAAIMQEPSLILPIRGLLLADDFAEVRHHSIFEAMLALFDKKIRPTLSNVQQKLTQQSWLVMAGGDEYVEGIPTALDGLPPAALVDAPVWASHIESLSARRALVRLSLDIDGKARNAGADPRELWTEVRTLVLSGKQRRADGYQQLRDGLPELREKMARWKLGKMTDTVLTGIDALDWLLIGLGRRRLTIIGARPGIGKTALVQCIAQNVEAAGGTVVFASLEMALDDLLLREVCRMAEIDSMQLRRGQVKDAGDWLRLDDAMLRVERDRLGLFIRTGVGQFALDMHYRAAALAVERGGIDLHITDYVELMGEAIEDKDTRLGVVMAQRRQKALAQGLNCAALSLSQLGRVVELGPARMPRLEHLMWGGEAEADNAAGLWWPRKVWERVGKFKIPEWVPTDPDGKPRWEDLFFMVFKARDGVEGIVRLKIIPQYGLITDPDDGMVIISRGDGEKIEDLPEPEKIDF